MGGASVLDNEKGESERKGALNQNRAKWFLEKSSIIQALVEEKGKDKHHTIFSNGDINKKKNLHTLTPFHRRLSEEMKGEGEMGSSPSWLA